MNAGRARAKPSAPARAQSTIVRELPPSIATIFPSWLHTAARTPLLTISDRAFSPCVATSSIVAMRRLRCASIHARWLPSGKAGYEHPFAQTSYSCPNAEVESKSCISTAPPWLRQPLPTT